MLLHLLRFTKDSNFGTSFVLLPDCKTGSKA